MRESKSHTVIIEIPIKELETLFEYVPIYDLYTKTGCVWCKRGNGDYYYEDTKPMKRMKALYKRLDKALRQGIYNESSK